MKISFKGRPNFLKEAGVLMALTKAKKLKNSLETYLFITEANSRNVQEQLGHYSIPILYGHAYVSQKVFKQSGIHLISSRKI